MLSLEQHLLGRPAGGGPSGCPNAPVSRVRPSAPAAGHATDSRPGEPRDQSALWAAPGGLSRAGSARPRARTPCAQTTRAAVRSAGPPWLGPPALRPTGPGHLDLPPLGSTRPPPSLRPASRCTWPRVSPDPATHPWGESRPRPVRVVLAAVPRLSPAAGPRAEGVPCEARTRALHGRVTVPVLVSRVLLSAEPPPVRAEASGRACRRDCSVPSPGTAQLRCRPGHPAPSWVFREAREGGRMSHLSGQPAQCVLCRRNAELLPGGGRRGFSRRASVQAAGSCRAVSGSELRA